LSSNVNNNSETFGSQHLTATSDYTLPETTFITGGLPRRGLTEESLTHYSIVVTDEEDMKLVFPYYSNGCLVGAKFKTVDKKFYYQGKQSGTFFGQNTVPRDRKDSIIVTEGELDAVAFYQATGIPTISIPTGAAGAAKFIKEHLKWLEQFKRIYISFDNDAAGNSAADEVVSLIRKDKCYRVSFHLPGIKDACGALEMGVRERSFDGEKYLRESLSLASSMIDENFSWKSTMPSFFGERSGDLLPSQPIRRIKTGIKELDNNLVLRQEEVTTIFSDPSVGKSSLVRQIAANRIKARKPVLMFVFEESIQTTVSKLGYMYTNSNEVYPTQYHPTLVEMKEAFVEACVISNYTGGCDLKRIETDIEYAVRSADVDLVIFDNVTACVSSEGERSMSAVNSLYALFVRLGKELKHHTIVVSHTKRDINIKTERGDIPNMHSCLFSGHVERLSHNLLALGRAENTDILKCAVRKQRDSGHTPKFDLVYNKDIFGFEDCYDINEKVNTTMNNKDNENYDNTTREQETEREENVQRESIGTEVRLSDGGESDERSGADTSDNEQQLQHGDDDREDKQSVEAVHSHRNSNAGVQPRRQVHPSVRKNDICGDKRTSQGTRQSKAAKLTDGLKRKPNISCASGIPVISEPHDSYFQRLGKKAWYPGDKRELSVMFNSENDWSGLEREATDILRYNRIKHRPHCGRVTIPRPVTEYMTKKIEGFCAFNGIRLTFIEPGDEEKYFSRRSPDKMEYVVSKREI
jgi:twinkle protein